MGASVLLLSGCALNMQVPVKDPVPSSSQYVKNAGVGPIALYFSDGQSPKDKAALVTGRIPMQMMYAEKPFDAVPWLATNTVKEMVARGLPVQLGKDANGANTVLVKRIHIENRRVSGFSPFETFTSLSADVVTSKGTQRITSFVKRGKVPVWSFNEVIDPTYNDALNVVTKELAAKLNQILYGVAISDAQVNALISKTSTDPVNFRDVYELGFGNNPLAIPALVKLSTHSSDEVMQAAVSSLGILRATGQFDLLVKANEKKGGSWEDRAIALKAIGDLGTPEARAYLQKEGARLEKLTDSESMRTKELIALYP